MFFNLGLLCLRGDDAGRSPNARLARKAAAEQVIIPETDITNSDVRVWVVTTARWVLLLALGLAVSEQQGTAAGFLVPLL